MISRAVQQIFIKAYTIIKLNLFFWGLSLCGGLVLGVGPALLVINELYYDYDFHYGQMSWKVAWKLFKENLTEGNKLFYSFAIVIFLLGYSLFLSVQLHGLTFIVTDFIIAIVLLATICIYAYVLNIKVSFEINLINSFKLACAHFFYNFFDNMKEILGIAVIIGITYKFSGLILFATFSLTVVYTQFVGKNWQSHVEELN